MSFVILDSAKLHEWCNRVLQRIEHEREKDRVEAVQEETARQNRWRRLLRRPLVDPVSERVHVSSEDIAALSKWSSQGTMKQLFGQIGALR